MTRKAIATVASFKDGDTTICVDWLGGDDHRVSFSNENEGEFKAVECQSLSYAFAAVYEFAAYDHLLIEDPYYKVDVRVGT